VLVRDGIAPLVNVREGKLRGIVAAGVHVFRGIPYAAQPFGPNRMRPPRPAERWVGVREATADGQIAPQANLAGSDAASFLPPGGAPGQDCLNLNVWTPDPGTTGLPVLVWITGGAFEAGSAGWYDGSRFARDGVVCVAINYRPGIEGFLHLRDAVANRGLLDQAAALAWVAENVAAFGGDPGNITVFGQSAGAMSIGCLLGMPEAAGLIRRAILQSGAAQHVMPPDDALRIGSMLAAKVGVAPTLAAMADVPWQRLVAAFGEMKAELAADPDPSRWGTEVVATSMPFQPVLDGTVLPGPPLDRIRKGSAAAVDIVIGTNADDWRLFLAASGMLLQVTDTALTAPVARSGYLSLNAYGLSAPTALAAYRAARPTASPGEVLAAVQTDWWCRIPAIRLADAHSASRAVGARTFMYEFAWPSPVAGGAFGACHALEIPFVFDTVDAGPSQMLGNLLGEDPPRQLATAMHSAWCSFAVDGDPGWAAYELERRATMRFDTEPRLVDDPYRWERGLWDGIR
jgi:para-nitrobenzyl esterase